MKAKIKSYILLLLVLTSVVQIGILWSYQSHGFPIGFLKTFLANGTDIQADSQLNEKFFVPFRVIASDGNEAHWIISRSSSSFAGLWEEARLNLGRILGSKQRPETTSEDWGTLVTKRGYVFEFKSQIQFELLKWFMDMPEASQEEPFSFRKIMVVPGMYGAATIYLLDGDPRNGRVLLYRIQGTAEGHENSAYEGVLSKLEKDENGRSLAYSIIGELYGKSIPNLSPDILFVPMDSNSKYRQYKTFNYSIPTTVYDLEQAADIIFNGNEKDSYDSYEDAKETKIFMNLDNMYKVYKDGLLEYKYLPAYEETEKESLSKAFMIAAKFVQNVKSSLNMGASIYLSEIKEESGAYRFVFDYMQGDTPVYFNMEPRGESSEPIRNAIVIRADSRRMLSCTWMLKTMDTGNGTEGYNLNLAELLDESGVKLDSTPIDDMGIAYVIEADTGRKLDPVWVIESPEEENHFVRLLNKDKE